MLGHLIRKEILDHLLSLRFLILSALGVLVIWLSLWSGYGYYRDVLRDYQLAQASTDLRLRQIKNADRLNPNNPWQEVNDRSYLVHNPPTPMSIFIRGMGPALGRSIPVGEYVYNRRMKFSPAATDPVFGFSPSMDLDLVVRVVLSLFVILFTYDAACGEKEGGTLRLMASFPLPKDRLLLSKFFGALIPILAVFGLPLALGIGVLLLMPDIQLTSTEMMRLGLILLAAGLYLGAFTCIGLLVSSLFHRAATSFVLLLAFWVTVIGVIPRLSLIAASGLRPAPSGQEHQAEEARLAREKLFADRLLRSKWQAAHNQWWTTPQGQAEFYQRYEQIMLEVDGTFNPQIERLEESFRNRYQARLALAVGLARFSPAFALKNAMIRLAGTGLERHRQFEQAYKQHKEREHAWSIRESVLYFQRRSFPAKYGSLRWDASGMPRFTYRPPSDDEGVRLALVDMGILALWGVAAFVGAYVAMLRYDVR